MRLARVISTDAHEGPVYVAGEDALYFTSLPRDGVVHIRRLALDGDRFPLESDRLTTVRPDANVANGMALDRDGRLVVCEQGTRTTDAAITRFAPPDGDAETLVDGWDGLPLNSPNDVVVAEDGAIWFTDPAYGHLQGFRPEPRLRDRVYRHDPSSNVTTVVAEGFDKPNGLAFSPGATTLYVGDSEACVVKAYNVVGGDRLEDERLFARIAPGYPDGIAVDGAGRVYVSSASGVHLFDPAGRRVGEIALPGAVNFTFGGRDGDLLFITADDAIWAADLQPHPERTTA
jgi:gluconolactonase